MSWTAGSLVFWGGIFLVMLATVVVDERRGKDWKGTHAHWNCARLGIIYISCVAVAGYAIALL